MDFFIVGYPKSGTTSLYEYLASRNDVFFPSIKEPHFFSDDFGGAKEVYDLDGYLGLYASATKEQLKADASASVIHSDVALDRILELYPSAKFIVVLREPVSAVRSFHGELLHNLNEDVEDFELAWRLQEDRATGKAIPAYCKEAKFLQYAKIYRYRKHLPAFFEKVPVSQRLVLVFEEFFSSPQAGYREVLDFLELEGDTRTEFDAKNTARRHRFRWLAKLHRKAVDNNGVLYRLLKACLSRVGVHPSKIIQSINHKPGSKSEISEAFESQLHHYFGPDVKAVEHLLGRRIDHWRR